MKRDGRRFVLLVNSSMPTLRKLLPSLRAEQVALLVLCLPAIWPFISRSDLPQTTDAELHIFRLAELSRLVREGILFPRWAPNFYFGYGYPIFNFYAPLSYYLALPIELLPKLGPVEAVKGLFIFSPVLAAYGTFGFVRANWGKLAGYIAVAMYIYAPYVLFIDPHARGDLPETVSLGLFPVALWALDRERRKPSWKSWLVAVFMALFVLLIHNLMAAVFFSILLAWTVWQAIPALFAAFSTGGRQDTAKLWELRLVGALLMGLLLSAFFWLPVALEQDAVNLGSLVGDGGHFDFRSHFLSFGDLLAFPKRFDWGATAPDYSFSIGFPQAVLLLIGVLGFVAGFVQQRRHILFFLALLLFLLFMMFSASTWLWELVTPLAFLQFPWRLLGPAAIIASIVAGAGLGGLLKKFSERAQKLLMVVATLAIIFAALPLLQVPPWSSDFGPTTASRVLEEEMKGRWLGTTSTADFVPNSVKVIPKPYPAIVNDFRANRPLDRVNRLTLPLGTTVEGTYHSPLRIRYIVDGTEAFLLRLFLFDFPGWTVKIDGVEVETEISEPEGFIVIPVPAGPHVVDVRFVDTWPRRLGYIISAAALLATVSLAALAHRRRALPSAEKNQQPSPTRKLSSTMGVDLLVILVAGLFVIVNGLFLDRLGLTRLESTGLEVQAADYSYSADFGEQVYLLGYDLSSESLRPGDELKITLYWRAQETLDINYQVFVHLLDEDRQLIAQSDRLNPGNFPTRWWPLDRYVWDRHILRLPGSLPPGEYQISAGLWVASEGWRLPIFDESGEQIADSIRLPVRVRIR